jgi:hypothetical protein
MIKVLWLEDEINKIEAFLDRLYMDGISVTHKDTANNFIAELNKNLDDYDAVILDVMGVVNSLEEKPTSKAFSVAHEEVLGLKHKKNVPFFVLSAQLTKDENQGLKEYIGDTHIYIKSKDEDKLINDIKRVVNEQTDFILRNKYSEILSVFNDNQLGANHYNRIFDLIKYAESSLDIERSEDLLPRIRKIIEAIFQALAKQGLVPSEITDNQGWINGSSKFISNTHSGFKLVENYIHPTAALSLERLLWIGQDAAHAEGDLKYRVDEYIQANGSGYLFKSCIFLLIDLIIWYKNLSEKYPNPDENRKKWEIKSAQVINLIGKLKQDSDNNYHIDQYIFQKKKVHGILNVDDEIEIINAVENTNPWTKQYPFFVTNFKKI